MRAWTETVVRGDELPETERGELTPGRVSCRLPPPVKVITSTRWSCSKQVGWERWIEGCRHR